LAVLGPSFSYFQSCLPSVETPTRPPLSNWTYCLTPPVFAMASTKEGLREFQRACSHFNYALSTPDASAIVVCSTGDYLIFIGSQPFVEQCAGTEEAAAFRLFREYADNPGWPDPKVRRNLQSIYTTLAQEFPGAPEGTF